MSVAVDWSDVCWTKPTDSQIRIYAKGGWFSDGTMAATEHVNWAFKEAGVCAIAFDGPGDSVGWGTLVAVCQKYVKDHNLKEPKESEVVYVQAKKKGWFWR